MPKGIPKRKPIDVEKIAAAARRRDAQWGEVPEKTQDAQLPAPPAPQLPNPVVLALQEQILGLVNQRRVEQDYIANANAELRNAEAAASSARERLQIVESEVQYRLRLIAQMQGGVVSQATTNDLLAAAANIRREVQAYETGHELQQPILYSGGNVQSGMGSIPAQRPIMPGVVGEVRSESAEDERRAM